MLSVLGDTDASELSLGALDLHRALGADGVEMRTVALGPGAHGGLDHLLPVLGPSSRSMAATLQLRREQRWADVVMCFGAQAAVAQRRTLPGSLPVVVVLADDETRSGPSPRRSRVRRAFAAAWAVVCVDDVAMQRWAMDDLGASGASKLRRLDPTPVARWCALLIEAGGLGGARGPVEVEPPEDESG